MKAQIVELQKIINNDTKLEPISWELNLKNPLLKFCVGAWVVGIFRQTFDLDQQNFQNQIPRESGMIFYMPRFGVISWITSNTQILKNRLYKKFWLFVVPEFSLNMTVIIHLWGQVLGVTIFWLSKLMMWAIPSWIKVMVNHYLPPLHHHLVWWTQINHTKKTTGDRTGGFTSAIKFSFCRQWRLVTIFPHFRSKSFYINELEHAAWFTFTKTWVTWEI